MKEEFKKTNILTSVPRRAREVFERRDLIN